MSLRAGSFQKAARLAVAKPPYGVSFPLEDLWEIKDWAGRSDLSLSIVLDHVIEGVEFEEVVIVSSPNGKKRLLTLWHTAKAVHAQAPDGRPRACATLMQALDMARPKRPGRQPWRLFQS